MWISKNEKQSYNDSAVKGIRLHFTNGITIQEKFACRKFCYWLVKCYWFPIRINIKFIDCSYFKAVDGHKYYGIFYANDEYKKRHYPEIRVAVKINSQLDEYNVFLTIAHELTHYFQWYFYEEKEKTARSLEVTATRWANYIVSEFYNYCNV